MIEKTGQITINDDEVLVSDFVFHYAANGSMELIKQDLKEYVCNLIDSAEGYEDLFGVISQENK